VCVCVWCVCGGGGWRVMCVCVCGNTQLINLLHFRRNLTSLVTNVTKELSEFLTNKIFHRSFFLYFLQQKKGHKNCFYLQKY
jgi:hypothetical protein